MNPLLQDYLHRLTSVGLPDPAQSLISNIQYPTEPGQPGRLLITGPRGCGKTTVMVAHASSAASEILTNLGKPLADILLPLAEAPIYLDMRQWGGSLLDLAATELSPGDIPAGQALTQEILSGPATLLLDHIESIQPGWDKDLGAQLAQWACPGRTSVWASWRALPGRTLSRWLGEWPQISLSDWSDAQVLQAVGVSFEPDVAPDVAHWLASDQQAWQAAHRPLFFSVMLKAIRACPPLPGGLIGRPTRSELAMRVLCALLDVQPDTLNDWLDHAGFGACRLAWRMLEQDMSTRSTASRLPVEEASRVVQESGGVTLDALLSAGVLTRTNGMVAFDQPLVANLCAAWYARARPERFGGGEQAEIGRAGRARALHHALDMSSPNDAVATLVTALDIAAPSEMLEAAAGWLAAAPSECAREILGAFSRQASPEVLILLAEALQIKSPASGGLAACAAELARAALRTRQLELSVLPGPAAPPSWPALRRAASNMLRAALEKAAGRPEAALHSAHSALAASIATAAWIAHDLGRMLLQQNDPATALQAFEQAIAMQPDEPKHYVQAGTAALAQDDAAKSLTHLQHAYELAPRDSQVCLALAEALAHAGYMDQARRYASEASDLLLPDQAQAWHRLAQAWAAMGESDRAIEGWQCSVSAAPEQAGWQIELAQAHLRRGEVEQAIKSCQRALAFCPNDALAHRVLGHAYLPDGERAEAARHLAIALYTEPDSAEIHLLNAEALGRINQVQAAISSFERVLNLHPGDLHAAVGLARLYADHDRPADAQAILDWILARQPDYPAALVVQALLAVKQNDLENAIRLYAEALAGTLEDATTQNSASEWRLQRARLCRQSGRLDEARDEIERVLAVHSDHPGALREMAQVHLAQQQPAAAIDCLRRIKSRHWDSEILCMWGQAKLATKLPSVALAIFAQVARTTASHAPAFEGLGHALGQLDRHAQAILAYKHAISLAPTHSEAYCALGRTYRQVGGVEESVAILSEAVRMVPDNITCRIELGQSLARLNWWREAEEQFARAASLAPGVASNWRWHGCALRHLKKFEEAGRSLERAIELDCDAAETLVELAWLYRDQGDAPRALTALEAAGAGRADDLATLVQVSRALREFGEPARAEDVLLNVGQDGILSDNVQMAALQLELGHARLAQNRDDVALAAFEQAVAIDPQQGEYHDALARTLAHLGRLDAAVQQWRQARDLGYETIAALQDQGQTLQRLGRDTEALAVYERLIELQPRDAHLYLSAAQVARNLGNVDRTLEMAGWATSLEPGLTPAYVLIGEVCMEHGRPDQALAALKRASDLAPGDRPVWLGLAKAALNSGQAETALHAAQTLVARNEDDADAYLVMGTAHLTRHEWLSASQTFKAALARRGNDPDAATGLGRALAALGLRAEIAQREGNAHRDDSSYAPTLSLPRPAGEGWGNDLELGVGLATLQQLEPKGANLQPELNVLKALLMSLSGEKAQAARHLKAMLTEASLSAEALSWMTIILRRAGAPRLGLSTIRRAAWLNRRDAQILYELGVTLEEAGRNERSGFLRARSAYMRAAALEPENGLLLHALARMHLRLDESGRARQALELALTHLPDAQGWYAELGQVCADQNDLEPAARALEQACALGSNAALHRQLGHIYARLERQAAAVTEMETALRLSPDQVEWWVELGSMHYEAGAGARALVCYRQALAHSPDDANLVLSAAQVAGELDRWEEALEMVKHALARAPDCAPLQSRAGALYERMGQLDLALEAHSRAARLAPEVAAHHLDAGRLALQLGHAELAARHLENAIRTDRRRRESYGLLGDAYLALGRQDEALQVYQHAATLEPGNVAHRLRLGRLYRHRNDPGQAMAHLEVALSLAPDDAAVLEEMLGLHEEQHEYRKALNLCLRLIELRSDAADCFRAGMLHKQLKEYPEALDMFKRATRLSPNHAEAYKQIAVVSAMGFFSK